MSKDQPKPPPSSTLEGGLGERLNARAAAEREITRLLRRAGDLRELLDCLPDPLEKRADQAFYELLWRSREER